MKLSLVVITLNEEDNIGRCLESVPDTCDKTVVDSGSTDETCSIAARHGARIITRSFTSYAEQWRFAIEQAPGEWVLVLAADENLTPDLREALQNLEPGRNAYRLLRRTFYMGRLLRFGPWMGETTLRLWKKGAVTVSERSVHEEFYTDEQTGLINTGCIEHRSYRSVSEHMERMSRYCALWADDAAKQGKRSTYFHLTARPLWRFVSAYFLRGGFFEGVPGLVASVTSAYYVFLKWAILRERNTG